MVDQQSASPTVEKAAAIAKDSMTGRQSLMESWPQIQEDQHQWPLMHPPKDQRSLKFTLYKFNLFFIEV